MSQTQVQDDQLSKLAQYAIKHMKMNNEFRNLNSNLVCVFNFFKLNQPFWRYRQDG